MRLAAGLSLFALAASGHELEISKAIPSGCRQMVLVTAPNWHSSKGTLRGFSRAGERAPWLPVGDPVPALIGERGLAWGLGLHAIPDDHAPRKTEGDRRSPAGIFPLIAVFSRETIDGARMRRIPLTPWTEAIDDPRSRYYNQIVDRREIAHPDWHSSERMAAIRDYAAGIVIGFNPSHQAGAGSCVFLHLWTGKRAGTAGCTALRRDDLLTLNRWLDPKKRPILIQLPEQ